MNSSLKSTVVETIPSTPSQRVTRWLIPFFLIGITSGGYAYLKHTQSVPVKAEKTEKAWPVDIQRVLAATETPQITLLGAVESPFSSTLSAVVSADVLETPKLEGIQVRKGDLLVRLDDKEIVLLLEQREADVLDLNAKVNSEIARHQANIEGLEGQKALLKLAENAVRREQKLSQSNVSSAAKIDQAQQSLETVRLNYIAKQLDVQDHPHRLAQLQAQLTRAKASVAQTRLDLSRTRIQAPYDGTITQLLVSPGERVRVGDKLVEMYDTEQAEIRAQIPERWVQNLSQALMAGQQPLAQLQAPYNGIGLTLIRLSGEVNSGTGGVDGLFRITSPDAGLIRGKTVNLTLNLPPIHQVYRLPISALYGTNRIYRLKDERLDALDIEVLGRNLEQEQQQILFTCATLKDQDQVITTQLPNAINGLKVIPRLSAPLEQ
ncbi:MAG: HlyD family efflux transporter periplasmic adaptor subunit [Hahellaceae bacterium]|nr:HlyD family efflux transporter periplasmic adaptor subunit [Hahellaceae bacterium]MCP5168710.1 HlyD family efflux transporter periplasmic adaptor subunit [Hahellaceae bacterium]